MLRRRGPHFRYHRCRVAVSTRADRLSTARLQRQVVRKIGPEVGGLYEWNAGRPHQRLIRWGAATETPTSPTDVATTQTGDAAAPVWAGAAIPAAIVTCRGRIARRPRRHAGRRLKHLILQVVAVGGGGGGQHFLPREKTGGPPRHGRPPGLPPAGAAAPGAPAGPTRQMFVSSR